jgi:plasmid stability protein
MCGTCQYVSDMAIMIQIRNVPDDLHRQLKARAALEGMSLSEFLLREARRIAERPTIAELRRRVQQRQRVRPRVAPARAVRRERDGR